MWGASPFRAGMEMGFAQRASGSEQQLVMGHSQAEKFSREGLQSFEMKQKNSCPLSPISGTHTHTHTHTHMHPLPKP
jgi:hypothetical protein